MLTREMFKQQLEDDPNREWFEVQIFLHSGDEYPVNDKIRECHFSLYSYASLDPIPVIGKYDILEAMRKSFMKKYKIK